MSSSETLLAHALLLPEDERIALAHRLFESVQPAPSGVDDANDTPEQVEAAWAKEIAERLAALERGELKTRPFGEAMTDLRAKLRARRAVASS